MNSTCFPDEPGGRGAVVDLVVEHHRQVASIAPAEVPF
jgi:hypothetical protein